MSDACPQPTTTLTLWQSPAGRSNTAALQDVIQWVREELGRQHGIPLERRQVTLRTGALADGVASVHVKLPAELALP